MRDFFAAFLSLVLPFNASTGTRIFLDGVNGRVLLYDQDDNLIMSMSPSDGVDDSGNVIRRGLTSYSNDGDFMSIGFDAAGNLRGYPPPGRPDMDQNGTLEFVAPDYDLPDNAPAGGIIIRVPDGYDSSYPYFSISSPSASGSIAPSATLGLSGGGNSYDLYNAFRFQINGFMVRRTHNGDGTQSDETWTALALQNGWTNTAGFAAASYRLYPDGTVGFRGSITPGTLADGTVVFALPHARYRPTEAAILPVGSVGSPAQSRIRVQSGGNCDIFGCAGSTGIRLTGLRFPVI